MNKHPAYNTTSINGVPMSLRGWFRGSTPKSSQNSSPGSSQVDLRAQTVALLQDAIAGADRIMNDDIDGAEEQLRQTTSTFHSFGMGTCVFMKSILGFEKAIMAEASSRLNECETSAWNEIKKAEKEASKLQTEKIYPPGSEYQLVLAESYLMSAIIGVLHESLTEGIKSFYKLRKAYVALDGIIQAESAYLQKRGLQPTPEQPATNPSRASKQEKMPGGFDDDDDDADLEFLDANESQSGAPTPLQYEGHLSNGDAGGAEKKLSDLSLNDNKPETKDVPRDSPSGDGFESGPDSDLFTDPIDAFIHS